MCRCHHCRGVCRHETLEKERTERFVSELEPYDVTTEIARYAGLLKKRVAGQGETLSLADTLIGATAIVYRITLVTDNRKDFPMPEIQHHPVSS